MLNSKDQPKHKFSVKTAFSKFIWPRRRLVSLGLILIVVNRVSSLVLPGASKYLIDDVVENKDLEMLRYLVIGLVISITIQSLSSFLLTKLLSVEAQRLISNLRAEVQKKVLSLPISYFDNNKSGALVSRIMTDVEGVRNLVGTGLVQLIGGTITAILSLGLLIRISPLMTMYVLVPIALFALIALKAFTYIRPIFRTRRVINADVTGRLTETLNGIRIIKGFNAEKQEADSFERGVERIFLNVKKSLTSTALVTSSGTFLIGLATVGIMGIGGYFIMYADLKTGEFLSFALYLGFMIAPIVQISNIGTQITEAFAGLDRTEEILRLKPENDPSERKHHLKNLKGDIKFDKVSFAYEEDEEVLHNISFEAPSGTVTALVGSSGSGKSTIAGLAASFLKTTNGSITIDDTEINTIDLGSFRRHLGVVLQDDFLFEGTIKENILFPRPEATEEMLNHAVTSAYVDEFTARFENGLDTVIGERGVKLSGGQRQRVAIARAILADPKIIILDEATSNLDTESEILIQRSLEKLVSGRTTIVIAHRLSTIRQANQILVIEKGEIVEQGSHDQLIEKNGRYQQLYTYQARI